MLRRSLLLGPLVVVGCGSRTDVPAAGAGSGSGSSGSSARVGSGSSSATASGSGSAAKTGLELGPGERLHDPSTEMPWTPPAGSMKVTLVDVAGTPETSRLVVWGGGRRHDVVTVATTCLPGEHGAEMWTGAKNTVVFRCESQGTDRVVADEWRIRWTETQELPTIDRHWRGGREQRDPRWAGGRRLYDPPKPAAPQATCCCSWQDEGEPGFEITTKDYCKGSEDHHGICVADAKCATADEP